MKKDTIIFGTIIIIIAILLVAVNIPTARDAFVDDYGTDYGAVGVWNFEEGVGATAFDQSPYGNDGDIINPTWVVGKFGEALTFNGSEYVNITNSMSLNISDYITIEAWARDPPSATHKVIVEKNDAYSLYINNTNILYGQINSTRVSYTVTTITDWHYYSMTYDSTILKLYVDGVLVNSTALTGSIALNTNNVTIGTRFLGEIDQVRIYKVAKTVGEIRNHYLNSGHMYSGSVIVSDDFRILNSTLDEQLGLDEDGNLTIGGTVDGRDIGSYHYEIISYDVQNLGKNPTNPPIIVIIDNCALWKFTVDTDKVHSTFPVPADYWGLDMDFYVVWTNDGGVDDNTKNVTWQMNYQTAKDGDQVSGSHANSPKSITDSYDSASGWIEHTTDKMIVGYADFQSKKCLIVQLMAVTPPGDALTCEPRMLGVCIGYWAVNVDDTSSS